jgi:regulator of PEP synthase PpsR (kinase-PPPase family)
VPLVRGIQPPGQLFGIDPRKIVGLTIDPERLARIRGRRVSAISAGRGRDGYADLARIVEEIEEADALQRRLGCPVIDVTAVAVEESAGRVIELVESRRVDARA